MRTIIRRKKSEKSRPESRAESRTGTGKRFSAPSKRFSAPKRGERKEYGGGERYGSGERSERRPSGRSASGRPERGERRFEKKKRPSLKGPWKKTAFSVKTQTAAPAEPKAAAPAAESNGLERIQKIIANAGVASRREAERMILEGAVTVNGATVTQLGSKADPLKDKIKVNGKMILTEVERLYIVFYKPRGVIATLKDPEGRPCIMDYLREVRERVVPVGQMDFNSEGLLLLTNDGMLVNAIIKTRSLPKVYMVKVKGHPEPRALSALRDGIFSAEGVVRFADLRIEQELGQKSWLKLEVTEGARLDLRELLNHRGLLVDRIIRTAMGPLTIQGMQPGEIKYVKQKDFASLTQY